jgi:hypothetical protein
VFVSRCSDKTERGNGCQNRQGKPRPAKATGVQASSSNSGRWLDPGRQHGPWPGRTAVVPLANSTRTGIVAVAGFCCFSSCRRFLLFVDCEARACCRIRRRSQDGSCNALIAAGVEGRAAARPRAHTSTLSSSSPLDQSRPLPIDRDVLATHACRQWPFEIPRAIKSAAPTSPCRQRRQRLTSNSSYVFLMNSQL